MRPLASAPCICTALLLLACGDAGGERDTQTGTAPATMSAGSGITVTAPADATGVDATGNPDATSSADATGGASTDPPATADADSGGLKFDVNKETGGIDPDSEGAVGCQKIDFLFVVDNSGSMSDEQNALAVSFGGFIDSIQNTVMAQDYQIMVIDTDAGSPFEEACIPMCFLFPECMGYPCDMLPMAEGCDVALGAGLIADPDGQTCGIVGDKRYMVDGQPDLAGTFECIAKVGTDGDGSERPMEAMVAAIAGLSKPGGCNEGFVRDDALLVVTYITDEEDDEESNGNPVGWNASLVAAKSGAEKSLVVLGLIGDSDQPNPVCQMDQAEASPRLREFAESFTYGSWGSICSLDYAPFFDAAVSVIDTACQQFEPPG